MNYEYYRKKPMPMCEINIYQLLSKNTNLIKCLNRKSNDKKILLYSLRSF